MVDGDIVAHSIHEEDGVGLVRQQVGQVDPELSRAHQPLLSLEEDLEGAHQLTVDKVVEVVEAVVVLERVGTGDEEGGEEVVVIDRRVAARDDHLVHMGLDRTEGRRERSEGTGLRQGRLLGFGGRRLLRRLRLDDVDDGCNLRFRFRFGFRLRLRLWNRFAFRLRLNLDGKLWFGFWLWLYDDLRLVLWYELDGRYDAHFLDALRLRRGHIHRSPEQVPEDVGDETAEDADKERKEEGFQETVPVLFLSRHD